MGQGNSRPPSLKLVPGPNLRGFDRKLAELRDNLLHSFDPSQA